MKYSNQIPANLLDNPNAGKLVRVLDELELHKTILLEKALRFYRPILSTDLLWLRRKLEDYGYPKVPSDFTKEQLDAMLLNVQHVMALRGSKEGLIYFLWVLTFGEITVDDSGLYPQSNYIIPGDTYYGYVSHIQPFNPSNLYIFSGVESFGTQTLTVTIKTKYHYMSTLRQYIKDHIREFLNFTDDNVQISITFLPGPYQTYSQPYQLFTI